jgi:hypothetical protein
VLNRPSICAKVLVGQLLGHLIVVSQSDKIMERQLCCAVC